MDKQLWELTFILRNGQGTACITDIQPADIDYQISQNEGGVLKLQTLNAQHKDWPVFLRLDLREVIGYYMKPFETYLAARGRLALS